LLALARVVQFAFAGALGFASVVEWAHAKRELSSPDGSLLYAVAMVIAAVATGFVAGEALRGEWPSW
jgi:hypothetical protein